MQPAVGLTSPTADQPGNARDRSAALASMMAGSIEGSFGLDPDGRCTFMNAAGAAMLGYDHDALTGKILHDLLQSRRVDSLPYALADSRINRSARDGLGIRVDDEVFWHFNGTPLAVSYLVLPLHCDGAPAGSIVNFTDIGARHRTEAEHVYLHKALREANVRLAEIFAQAPAFMCVLRGPQHRFELVNDRYLQLVGNRRDIVGKDVRDALPEVAGQGFFELLDAVYCSGEPFVGVDMPVSVQAIADAPLEPRVIDLSYIPLRDFEGVISGILALGVDQTDRKRAEQAFRQSEDRFRALVTSMDEGFCVVELLYDAAGRPIDYRFLEANTAFESQSGLRDAVGRTIRELVPEFEQRWIDLYALVLATGEPQRFIDHAVSMARWFDVYVTRVGESASGRVAILFKDITQRKHAEEKLRQMAADLSEGDRRKSEFLATLAHELRNPLAPIRSGLQLMKLSQDKPAVVVRVREMMERQVDQMVHLIDDLMDVARINGGKIDLRVKSTDLKTLLESAVETSLPLIVAAAHELVVELPEAPLLLDADPTRIAQIFANLLNNAAKYTPAGGKIVLSARREGDSVVVVVSDNGVGIAPESLPKIFDMFNQVGRNLDRAQGGLGIGLSLVHRLVEMHGGSVRADSAGIDTGTTVTVTLPLAQIADQPTTESDAVANDDVPAKHLTRPLRIMVVDDNIDAAQTLAATLAMKGHATVLAYDGLQALEEAHQFLPQVAFLDIGMPGLNGYETAQALRKIAGLQSIVLIALTGWGTDADRVRTLEAGFNHHLTKPLELATLDALLSKVSEMLSVR